MLGAQLLSSFAAGFMSSQLPLRPDASQSHRKTGCNVTGIRSLRDHHVEQAKINPLNYRQFASADLKKA